MTRATIFTALTGAMALFFIGEAQAAPKEYRNDKYGFSLQYPADVFVLERTAEAGDGQVYVARDADARLLVGALINDSRFSPSGYRDYLAKQSYSQYQIEYQPLGQTWFVLSGQGNGKMFYEKVMFSCGGRLINSFAMVYPTDQRQTFDPIVEDIEKTFRPGQDCKRAGLPADRPERAASRPRDRSRFTSGERSGMADRIAKSRGQDVIVILRRTSPPYDRKVVRGYVSAP
jgi:hypothetical protein